MLFLSKISFSELYTEMEIKKYCIFIYIGQKMSQQYFGYLFCIRMERNNTIFYAKYMMFFLFVDKIL